MEILKIMCPYHKTNQLITSIYNPQSMVCLQCKQEKKDGRDGIYDITELQSKNNLITYVVSKDLIECTLNIFKNELNKNFKISYYYFSWRDCDFFKLNIPKGKALNIKFNQSSSFGYSYDDLLQALNNDFHNNKFDILILDTVAAISGLDNSHNIKKLQKFIYENNIKTFLLEYRENDTVKNISSSFFN